MLTLRRPSEAQIARVLERQGASDFSYDHVGATRESELPAGFYVNRFSAEIGHGEEELRRACAGLQRLRVFDLSWTSLWPRDAEASPGCTVGVLARAFGVWSFGVGRIVYAAQTPGAAPGYGFAFGTLPDHPIRGEERFSVSYRAEDGAVLYEIRSFSRPRQLSARLMQSAVHRRQRRFCRDSAEVMKRVAAG